MAESDKVINPKILSQRIRQRREELGLSQSELARCSNLTPAAINQFEKGERTPSLGVLKTLSEALEVSISYLMGENKDSEIAELLSDKRTESFFREYTNLSSKDKETLGRIIQGLKAKKEK